MKTIANNRAVTIKDIAGLAGVSVSTVSRSLNDSPLVAAETKERVKRLAEKLGFEFNASARGLITSQVGTVGIVLPESFYQFQVNLYHAQLLNDMRMMLEKEDVDLIVAFPRNHFSGQNNIKKLVTRRKVDGLILLLPELEGDTRAFLEDRRFPYVFSHYPPHSDEEGVDVVHTDHKKGGALAAEHLLGQGARRILCLRPESRDREWDLRLAGFRERLAAEGVGLDDDNIFWGDAHHASAERIPLENRRAFARADACFVLNDLMAFGLIKGLRQAGFAVPGDIRVIGYDNVEFSQVVSPALTTVAQPKEEIARLTLQHLLKKIAVLREDRSHTARQIMIAPRLVVRDSG